MRKPVLAVAAGAAAFALVAAAATQLTVTNAPGDPRYGQKTAIECDLGTVEVQAINTYDELTDTSLVTGFQAKASTAYDAATCGIVGNAYSVYVAVPVSGDEAVTNAKLLATANPVAFGTAVEAKVTRYLMTAPSSTFAAADTWYTIGTTGATGSIYGDYTGSATAVMDETSPAAGYVFALAAPTGVAAAPAFVNLVKAPNTAKVTISTATDLSVWVAVQPPILTLDRPAQS